MNDSIHGGLGAAPAEATDLFLSLTPEAVLAAVEAGGMSVNPVCYALNSYENRVYEVELEDRTRVVAKFYRPGRWSEAQLLEEHAFMNALEAAELPICGLRPFPDGTTLRRTGHSSGDIWYCLYDRKAGRAPDEIDGEMAERMGMFTARMHNVGADPAALGDPAASVRLRLKADAWIRDNIDWLIEGGHLPEFVRDRYMDAAFDLADLADERMKGVPVLRVHGDLHAGNLLLRNDLLTALDFDDSVVGPAVQDLWLLMQGRDDHTVRLRQRWLEGYRQLREFDDAWLSLIEPLRGMRIVHYTTWLARRWHDPVFPQTWPDFGTDQYWQDELLALENTLAAAKGTLDPDGEAAAEGEAEPELTNKDFFWDWEG